MRSIIEIAAALLLIIGIFNEEKIARLERRIRLLLKRSCRRSRLRIIP